MTPPREEDTGRSSFRELVIVGLEQVNDELKEQRKAHSKADQEWREAIAELRVVVARLETKIAIYSGLGALVGGAAVTWLAEKLHP